MEAHSVESLGIAHCLYNWLTDGSEVVRLTYRLHSTSQKLLFWYSFMLQAEYTPGSSVAGRIICSKTIKRKAIYRCCKSSMESYIYKKKGPLKTAAHFSKVYILALYIKPAHYYTEKN
jgi:hypothetical protein